MNVNQMTEKAREALLAAQELAGSTRPSANRTRAPPRDAGEPEGRGRSGGAP